MKIRTYEGLQKKLIETESELKKANKYIKEMKEKMNDPQCVFITMLRGNMAKPPIDLLGKLYETDPMVFFGLGKDVKGDWSYEDKL